MVIIDRKLVASTVAVGVLGSSPKPMLLPLCRKLTVRGQPLELNAIGLVVSSGRMCPMPVSGKPTSNPIRSRCVALRLYLDAVTANATAYPRSPDNTVVRKRAIVPSSCTS